MKFKIILILILIIWITKPELKSESKKIIQLQHSPTLRSSVNTKIVAAGDLSEDNCEIVEATAYTSRISETDLNPCVAASGIDICKTLGNYIAGNNRPMGSKWLINDKIFILSDRMNQRYGSNNIDIYFRYDLNGALKFGRKSIKICEIK